MRPEPEMDTALRLRLTTDVLASTFSDLESWQINALVTWASLCLSCDPETLRCLWNALPDSDKTPQHLHP